MFLEKWPAELCSMRVHENFAPTGNIMSTHAIRQPLQKTLSPVA